MNGYLKNYFQRIKNTKKFAREKNTHWIFPVFDALVISVLFLNHTLYVSVGLGNYSS